MFQYLYIVCILIPKYVDLKLKLSTGHMNIFSKKVYGPNSSVLFFTFTLKPEDKMKAKIHPKSIHLNDLIYYEFTFIKITITKIIYKNINKVVVYFTY